MAHLKPAHRGISIGKPGLAMALCLCMAACGGGSDSGFVPNPFAGAAPPSVVQPPAPDTSVTEVAPPATIPLAADKPFTDNTAYSGEPDAALDSAVEGAAVVQRDAVIDGKTIRYTATTGHLVTEDAKTLAKNASIFYVAYTVDNVPAAKRPVTFIYNGGPGSPSIWLMMGSFGPTFTPTSMPDFTAPAPYTVKDNPDNLLDRTDLVFIHPVGTGYSTAIKPAVNSDFWGADQDAESVKQFIKRYLHVNGRMNSPKFLLGESYGGHRSSILSLRLQREAIDLNGIVLIGPSTNNTLGEDSVGKLATFAANAWYHKKLAPVHAAKPLQDLMNEVVLFSDGTYAKALANAALMTPEIKTQVSDYLGMPVSVLTASGKLPSSATLRNRLLVDQFLTIGRYDGRATRLFTPGAAASVSDDPSSVNISSAFYATFNTLLREELKYFPASPFTKPADNAVINNWDWTHAQPGKRANGDSYGELVTTEDLALTMSLNPDLKIFVATGLYDSAITFHQTELNLLGSTLDSKIKAANLRMKAYPSGHMLYLDQAVKSTLRQDVSSFYDTATQRDPTARILKRQAETASLLMD